MFNLLALNVREKQASKNPSCFFNTPFHPSKDGSPPSGVILLDPEGI